jgi:tetratricopeptide (TPR) repeat protein
MSNETSERATLIHREIIQLVILVLLAIVAFFVTRSVAANNRDIRLRNAAEWYRQGQVDLAAGSVDPAIDAFRRAIVRNRTNKPYVLALARSLSLKGDHDGARAVLLALRESSPEDVDINVQLARLAVARQDVTEARRFYDAALYAPWMPDRADERRHVRLEFVRFLLGHGQRSRAQAELLASIGGLPDDPSHHLELANLFVEAGDDEHALTEFQRALVVDPENADALAGASQAAFHVGRYADARRYLRRMPADSEHVRNTREIVELILSRDPLATRIGSTERRRRLMNNLSYAQQRFAACLGQRGAPPAADALALQSELQSFDVQLKRRPQLDQDTVESGVDLIDRVERSAIENCGPSTALDRALLLIGRQHGAESR